MGREWEGTDTDEDNDNNNMTSHCDSLVKAPLIASRDLGKRQGLATASWLLLFIIGAPKKQLNLGFHCQRTLQTDVHFARGFFTEIDGTGVRQTHHTNPRHQSTSSQNETSVGRAGGKTNRPILLTKRPRKLITQRGLKSVGTLWIEMFCGVAGQSVTAI